MRPLNVLFVSLTEAANGAERVMLEFIEGLDRTRYRPHVVVPAEGSVSERCRALGIHTSVVYARWWLPPLSEAALGWYPWRRYLEDAPQFVDPLVAIIRRENIDVIYSCSACILHGALAALLTGRPHVHHLQEGLGDPYYDRVMPMREPAAAYRVIGWLSSRVVCIAEATQREIGTAISRTKLRLVRLGFRRIDAEQRAFPFPDDGARVRVGIVAGVWRRKGSDLIGPIVQKVCAVRPDVHFYWLGAGEADLLGRLTAAGEVDGVRHLHFFGQSNDVPAFMHSIDFLLHPTLSECFPRVIVEAALAGRASISTRCGALEEMIEDGASGLLAPVGDIETLSHHVLSLAADCDRAAALGKVAAARAANLTMAAYVAGMERVLTEAVAAGPVAASGLKRSALAAVFRTGATVVPLARAVMGKRRAPAADVAITAQKRA